METTVFAIVCDLRFAIVCDHMETSLYDLLEDSGIQLFRQRLSHESVKAYAIMSIGIMGSKSLALFD